MHLEKSNENIRKKTIILSIYLLNLFLGLYPLWKGGDVWLRFKELSDFEAAYYRPIVFVEFFLAILFFLIVKSFKTKSYFLLLAFTIFYSISLLFNGLQTALFSIIAMPLIYVVVIESFKLNIKSVGYIIYSIILLWIFIPYVDCYFSPDSRRVLFYGFTGDKDFHGYALHNNTYAYIVGLCILMTYFLKLSKLFKYVAIIALFASLLYSECRSVLVAIVVLFMVSIYYRYGINKIPLIIKILILFLLVTTIIFCYGKYEITFFDDPERVYILGKFYSIIQANVFWGTGTSTVVEPFVGIDPNPAHNFIIQGWADRGIFTLIFYLLFLWQLIKENNTIVKVFIIYMMIVGLFQPYLNIAIPSSLMILCFLTPFVITSNSDTLLVYEKK